MLETKVLPRTIVTRVVGVSYGNRQQVIASLNKGEAVYLVRDPENNHDTNAVEIVCKDQQQIGFLNRDMAALIAPVLDGCEGVLRASVVALTGGYDAFSFRGVLIRLDLPPHN